VKVGAMKNSAKIRIPSLLVVPAAALALFAAGCGSDDDKKSDSAATSSTPTQQSSTAKAPGTPPANDQAAGGEDAVKEAILTWTFKGDCDVMTDKFLEEQAFIGDNRKARCDYFEKAFQKPQYSESDVKFRKITITGNKAVATVGSDLANITTDYNMVAEGGQWKIDSTD
jgi:hypothetical protein